MMRKKGKKLYYAKVFISMAISLLIVGYFSPIAFIGKTPRVNPDLPLEIKKQLSYLIQNPSETPETTIATFTLASIPTNYSPEKTVYELISPGVYAGKNQETGQKYLKIDVTKQFKVTDYKNGFILYEVENPL